MRGDDASDALAVDTWQDLLTLARPLWRYLATRWLALRQPRTKHTRQILAPEWQALADDGFGDGVWSGADADLYRLKREAADSNTTAHLAGYIVAGLAHHRFRLAPAASLDDTLPIMLERAQAHAKRRGTTLDARAQAKVERWEAESESMAHGRGGAPSSKRSTT